MKTYLITLIALTLCVGSVSRADTATWADLEVNETVVLDRDLKINADLTLKAGTELLVREMDDLNPVEVEVITFKVLNLDSVAPVDMTILDDTYGIELNSYGVADFYIETKDLFAPSYFTKKSTP